MFAVTTVADVLSNHHQRGRQNSENGEPFKARGVEGWQREPVRLGNRGGIHNAHHEGERVTRQHADQIGIIAIKPRNRTEPKTVTPSVTSEIMMVLESGD